MIEVTDKVALPDTGKWGETMVKMEVGESFPVPNGEEDSVRHVAWRLFHRMSDSTKKPVSDKQFAVKRDPTDSNNFRCWRKK